MIVRTLTVAFCCASAVAVAAQPPETQSQPSEPQTDAAPPPEAPFDENPFDIEEPENELDALSRTTATPFPTFDEMKERRPVSVTLRALDKITARYTDIEAPMGEMAQFNSLEILPRFCDKRPPEEFPETTAFLEVFDRDLARARASASASLKGAGAPAALELEASPPGERSAPEETTYDDELPVDMSGIAPITEYVGPHSPQTTAVDPDRIFSGWMFASSPGLNSLEHPVYDVWVIDCTTELVESEAPPL